MDPRDIALIESLLSEHTELRQLWQSHQRLEEELNRLRAQRFLTPEEQQRQKEIQKTKLVGKDRIQAILRGHR
jgi:uncharacterized protein YdcH (DUF465 family)